MKMTKQVQIIVNEINDYFRQEHIKDESNGAFVHVSWLLSKANCYHGFNYFTADGRLSGGKNEDFDHLEFYIF